MLVERKRDRKSPAGVGVVMTTQVQSQEDLLHLEETEADKGLDKPDWWRNKDQQIMSMNFPICSVSVPPA